MMKCIYTYPETNNASEDAPDQNTPYDVPPVVTPTLRRSQRIIRKPERYTDSQY